MLKKSLRSPVGKLQQGARVLYKGKILTLKVSSNKLQHSRVGVIIGKGIIKKANKRNKIKRTVFSVFEKSPEIINRSGRDYIVIIKNRDGLDAGDFGGLTSELEASLSNIKNDN